MKVITTFTQTLRAKLAIGLLISITVFSACEDPSSIGLELDPNSNQIGVFYQEIPLTALVVRQDSVLTTNREALVFGGDISDFFGKTEATAYSRLLFNRDLIRPGANATLDSVRFNFNFRAVNGDDLSQSKTIKVHKLKEQIRDINYYSFNSLEFEEEPIFSSSFNFANRQDTLVFTKLENNSFANELFEAIKDGAILRDNFTFREFVPGIAFKGDPTENVSYHLIPSTNTGFVFFFRNEGDTISRSFTVATGVNFNSARHFNQITVDPTGTPTEAVTENFVAYDLGGLAGSKNNTGLVVKLDMSPLDAFLDTLRNVTFNQVILELGPMKRNVATNRPPQLLQMFFTNETNRKLMGEGGAFAVQSDNRPQFNEETGQPVVGDFPAFLTHDREKNIYTQSITSHVSAVYRGNIQRRDFILYPLVPGSDEYRQSLREFVIDSRSPILKIYYSSIRAF